MTTKGNKGNVSRSCRPGSAALDLPVQPQRSCFLRAVPCPTIGIASLPPRSSALFHNGLGRMEMAGPSDSESDSESESDSDFPSARRSPLSRLWTKSTWPGGGRELGTGAPGRPGGSWQAVDKMVAQNCYLTVPTVLTIDHPTPTPIPSFPTTHHPMSLQTFTRASSSSYISTYTFGYGLEGKGREGI